MEETELQLKLNNARLYNDLKRAKEDSKLHLEEKNKVKDLIREYKTALECKNKECEVLKNENENLKRKYNKIPEFIRNFFNE